MPARYYFADKSETLDPNIIIPKIKNRLEDYLVGYKQSVYIYAEEEEIKGGEPIKIKTGTVALFMLGTTGQLVKALDAGLAAGVLSFYLIPNTVLHIRYIRVRKGIQSKTVFGIGALKEYWGRTMQNWKETDAAGFHWMPMHIAGPMSGASYSRDQRDSPSVTTVGLKNALRVAEGDRAPWF